MKNTIIYIDGQNFLYKVSERLIAANLISGKQDIHSINIRELLEPLFPNHNLEIRYYGVKKISSGRSRDEGIQEKSKHFADSLRRLKNYLKKNGVKVSYISFSGQATTSLVKLANKHFVLKDADICKAYIDSINE